jgi:hypothetical protein
MTVVFEDLLERESSSSLTTFPSRRTTANVNN